MFPALLGDGQGRYRVHIMGNSGKLTSKISQTLFKLFNFAGSGKASVPPPL